ncbi:hypothetical protein TCAL_16135, partial [Tigriopus californicus]
QSHPEKNSKVIVKVPDKSWAVKHETCQDSFSLWSNIRADMVSKSLLSNLVILGLVLLIRGEDLKNQRHGKQFSLFNIITFENPEYPSTSPPSQESAFTFSRIAENLCQIRLDFENFESAQPPSAPTLLHGDCATSGDFLTITSPTQSSPPVTCGTLTGQHKHDKAFEDVKAAMSDLPKITPYDPELQTVVETDAAKKRGIEYILKQRGKDGCWRLIEVKSKWLSESESNYGNTTLEMMGGYWVTRKLDVFLRGLSHLTIMADHQAMVPIMTSKTLDAIENPRQRRIKERMQLRYNFTCKWIPGKDMYASDALSRCPVEIPEDSGLLHDDQVGWPIVCGIRGDLDENNEIRDLQIEGLKSQAKQGSGYCELVEQICRGFLNKKNSLTPALQPFWNERNNLRHWNGLVVLDGKHIVIPQNEQGAILKKLQLLHLGMIDATTCPTVVQFGSTATGSGSHCGGVLNTVLDSNTPGSVI